MHTEHTAELVPHEGDYEGAPSCTFEVGGVREALQARITPQTFTPDSNTGWGFWYPGSCSASANPGSTANTSRNCFCSYRVKSVQQGIAAQEVTASWKFKINQLGLSNPSFATVWHCPTQALTGAQMEVGNSLRSTSFILCGHINTA